ncbi:AlpA family phage regulatory protein [Pseudomonas aeruginosa]|uniref:helix-turn-helix transcriptional regulator n=1 Tax=Pseudomonas aeruginosa TaxID=287 RepID=UPI00190C351A|nr:AlpA family transcriptional regulator [Pseudomonas aeruginosa]MBK3752269.1 AlpA family phage regulatory protein [Pseudomonas aeruginosa]MBK3762507.1 AlpA family phage regulatory protein [Pseudomonas aeruginosa]MBK3769047.1 AlpA family phage regulatory protein [Pseudomonas aeruginosa]MBK3789235.1 AlpA family phage regulatory protein [Pseudomonas aeruginosa]MBK3885281.1 AlpA family phage regulatory protein [Pseudomonas aeruginosa]
MSRRNAASFQPTQGLQLGNRLLRRREVEMKTGKSRAAIYAEIRAGTFPEPVPIGRNSVAWLEAEVDQWISDRLAERNRASATRGARTTRLTQEIQP